MDESSGVCSSSDILSGQVTFFGPNNGQHSRKLRLFRPFLFRFRLVPRSFSFRLVTQPVELKGNETDRGEGAAGTKMKRIGNGAGTPPELKGNEKIMMNTESKK